MVCAICERETPPAFVEKHHLVPRCKKGENTIKVCVDCGNQIHELFSIRELKYIYNTLESLKSSEKVQKWIKWIRRKNDFGVCMKAKKRV